MLCRLKQVKASIHLSLSYARVTNETAEQILKLAACAGDAALSDVCFSKLTVDLDRFFTTEAFTDYMSVEHMNGLLTNADVRRLGGQCHLRAIALWIDAGKNADSPNPRLDCLQELLPYVELQALDMKHSTICSHLTMTW